MTKITVNFFSNGENCSANVNFEYISSARSVHAEIRERENCRVLFFQSSLVDTQSCSRLGCMRKKHDRVSDNFTSLK